MRFGSVCSGIEAASVAWDCLGWKVAWVSEVDVGASQVLAHRLGATAPRFPMNAATQKAAARLNWGDHLTNWGDMTRLPDLIAEGAADAPDILCGGTPCQAFSIAGARRGLADARGNLTLTFCQIADSIDLKRAQRGEQPAIIFWENVPGVITSKDNAFGCLLAGLAGEDVPIEPPGGKWTNAGVVLGPQRAVAWRICDAQYFGLAQRRKRVFVVASALEGFDPAAILLEFDGVRRDSAPRREAWEDITHATSPCLTSSGSGRGVERAGDTRGQDPVVAVFRPVLTPTWWDGRPISQTLDAVLHKGQTMPEKNRFPAVPHPVEVQSCYRTTGNAGCFDTGSTTHALTTATDPNAHVIVRSVALRGRDEGAMAELGDDLAFTLRASGGGGDKPHVLAFSSKDYGADVSTDVAPTMRAMNHSASHANAGGQLAVAYPLLEVGARTGVSTDDPRAGIGIGNEHDPMFTLQASKQHGVCVTGEVTHTLRAEGFDTSEDGTGRGNPITNYEMLVRRLLPVECERLQGFEDGWTDVPVGKKRAADGPRYKQLGNSWAVPVVRWIGRRIQRHLDDLRTVDLSPVEVDAQIIWLLLP